MTTRRRAGTAGAEPPRTVPHILLQLATVLAPASYVSSPAPPHRRLSDAALPPALSQIDRVLLVTAFGLLSTTSRPLGGASRHHPHPWPLLGPLVHTRGKA